MAISDWPIAERPRERLLAKSAVELARELLERFDGLTGLFSAGDELAKVKGLGDAKRAQFAAAIELARRSIEEKLQSGAALNSPGAVRDYLRLALGGKLHEVFVCIWLDVQHRVIKFDEPFRGTLTQTSVYPREIVKAALAANAAAVIFAHNHPSGAAQPSQADELLTRSLKEALALVDVKVLDHFIVAGNQALSFAERGLL